MFYRFKDGVFLIIGARKSAILDTNSGKVFSLNAKATAIVSGRLDNSRFWQELENMDLLEPSDKVLILPELPKKYQFTLNFVWFEIISSDCNESCLHCYADCMPPTYRRARGLPCQGNLPQTEKLSFQEWKNLIRESYDMGCRQCQFIGGEPFLYREGKKSVLDLAEDAVGLGYEMVEIFTNATLLTENKIQRIQELGLHIAVSLYSCDETVHDSITQTPGSFRKTMCAIERLKKLHISTRIGFVVMRQNESTVSKTMEFIDGMDLRGGIPDPLRPTGRGEQAELLPSASTLVKYGITTKPNFVANSQIIHHYSSGHSCLAGKITITESGDVIPCIFSRRQIVGNVKRDNGIRNIVGTAGLQKIWNTTKDDILVCKDCEYRYVCFDCRPLSENAAMGESDFLCAPYPRCSYNPYTGEWGEGIWCMKDGKPYFDTSLKETIKEVTTVNSSISTPPTDC